MGRGLTETTEVGPPTTYGKLGTEVGSRNSNGLAGLDKMQREGRVQVEGLCEVEREKGHGSVVKHVFGTRRVPSQTNKVL